MAILPHKALHQPSVTSPTPCLPDSSVPSPSPSPLPSLVTACQGIRDENPVPGDTSAPSLHHLPVTPTTLM